MVKESKNFNIEQDQKQTQKLNSKETSNEDQKHSKKIKKQKYKRPQKEKNIYIDNSSEIEEAFNNNKFISNDIRKEYESSSTIIATPLFNIGDDIGLVIYNKFIKILDI